METPFTPRNVAKYAVKFIVAARVAQVAENTITDYTRFEEDDMIVDISSSVVGWYVSDKLKPYTDKMVDKTADFIAEKRGKKAPTTDTQ